VIAAFEEFHVGHRVTLRISSEKPIATDDSNLVPICTKHHHLVHEGGWQLHLAPDRTLTVTRPGGTTSTNGPPTIRAA